jgi:hypothetical protein
MGRYENQLEGVGLRLENMPTDIKRFYWILAQEGCHPKATHRILGRIATNGYDLLTVMAFLPFEWIQAELKKIGVVMEFIEPLKGWKGIYDDGAWPPNSLPDRFKERDKKRSIF